MTDVLNLVIMETASSVIHIVWSGKDLSTDPRILLSLESKRRHNLLKSLYILFPGLNPIKTQHVPTIRR